MNSTTMINIVYIIKKVNRVHALKVFCYGEGSKQFTPYTWELLHWFWLAQSGDKNISSEEAVKPCTFP